MPDADNGSEYLERFGLTDSTVMALSPCLQGINVTSDDVVDIGKGLVENWSLTSLELTRCHVNEAGAFAIAEALYVNHTLRYLGLSRNNLGDSGCKAICDALCMNQALEIIDLSHCSIGDYGALAVAHFMEEQPEVTQEKKCGEVRSITLDGNRIGKPGAAALAAALTQTKKVKSLSLSSNRLREAGAVCLAQGISVNTSLTYLNVGDNDINPEGGLALINALAHNNTISAIHLSKNRLGPSVVGLAEICNSNTSLRDLGLEGVCMDAKTAEAFASALLSPSLLSINVGFNVLKNEGVAALCKGLRGKTLRYLDMSSVGLTEDGVEAVCDLLNIAPCLQTLQLDGNLIGPSGMKQLAAQLASSTTVDSFNLGETLIQDDGVVHLCHALRQNLAIRCLDLSGNEITNDGCLILCDVLSGMRRLTELDLSNNRIRSTARVLRALCSLYSNNNELVQVNLSGNQVGDSYPGGLFTLQIAMEACGVAGLPKVDVTIDGKGADGGKLIVSDEKLRDSVRGKVFADVGNTTLFRPAWAPAIPPPKVYGDEPQKSVEDEDEDLVEDSSVPPLIPQPGSLLHPLYPGYGKGRMSNECHCDTLMNTTPLPVFQSNPELSAENYRSSHGVENMFRLPLLRARKKSPYSLQSLDKNIGGLPITEEALRRKFQELDVDGTGFLDYREFRQIYTNFQNFGLYQADQEIEVILKRYKILEDNKITFDEFALIMLALAKR